MFHIQRFITDQINKQTELIFYWDLTGEPVKDGGTFGSPENAIKYLIGSKRCYILRKFEKFIHHKKHIADNSNLPYYKTDEYTKAFQRCLELLNWVGTADPSLRDFATNILKCQNHLQQILPVPGNTSYQSSSIELNEIISFCKSAIENK